MAARDPRADARRRRAPDARAGARRRARPALGPHRGDLRRGSVSRSRRWASPTCAACRATTSRDGVVATGKHFVGYGASEGGMNWAPAHLGAARAARGVRLPVRGRDPRGRAGVDHERLQRDRRRALRRARRRCSPICCAASSASTASWSPTTSPSTRCTATITSPPTRATPRAARWRPGSTSSCRRSTATARRCASAVERGAVADGARRPRRAPPAAHEARARPLRAAVRRRRRPRRASSTRRRSARWPARSPGKSIVLLKNDGGLLPLREGPAPHRRHRPVGRRASACCRATTTIPAHLEIIFGADRRARAGAASRCRRRASISAEHFVRPW